MEFIIRELQETDNNNRFIKLQKEFLTQMDTYQEDFSDGVYIIDTFDSDEENPCLIVMADTEMIAYTMLYKEEEYYDNKETIIIADIFVSKEYQRDGIGSLLIKSIKEYSQKRNISFLYTSVLPGNLQARNFFKKMGFSEKGKESFVMNLTNFY